MALNSKMALKGKLQQLKETLDRYQTDNTDFIVLHAGLSKFRTLRCFLVAPDFSNACVYDIIAPKAPKQTALSVKQEAVRKLKADLGALSEEEKQAMKQDMEIQMEFMNNPFFYADVTDLLIDLNFKNYLQTEFNAVFLQEGNMIGNFTEVGEKVEEVFVVSMKAEKDRVKIMKVIGEIVQNKKSPHIFYTTYKNALDISTVPLQLENFAETAEFFEGLDPTIREKCKVSPLKTKTNFRNPNENMISLIDDKRHTEIRFAKSLNKKPLRKFSPNQTLRNMQTYGILPALPQRYIIDKQNFKIPSLRHLFYDEYKYPILEKKTEEADYTKEEYEVQEALRRKQEQMKKLKAAMGATQLQLCKRAAKERSSPEKLLQQQNPLHSLRLSGSADTLLTTARRSPQKKFALDYAMVQTIKTNFRSFNPKPAPKTSSSGTKASPAKPKSQKRDLTGIIPKYKSSPYLRQIICRYHLSFEKLDGMIYQFVYLSKVSTFLNDHSKDPSGLSERSQKEDQMIKRLLEMTKLDPKEVSDVIDYGNYSSLAANLAVVKAYCRKLSRLPQAIFNRMLLAMNINPIKGMQVSLDTYIKIRYYLIDLKADSKEFISFSKRFIDPTGSKSIGVDDLMRIFKLALIRDEDDNAKRELLLKALLSNFALCGIIDTDGKFHPEVFDEIYKKNKMNIISFIKILLS